MNNRHAALLDIMCLANCLSRELGLSLIHI